MGFALFFSKKRAFIDWLNICQTLKNPLKMGQMMPKEMVLFLYAIGILILSALSGCGGEKKNTVSSTMPLPLRKDSAVPIEHFDGKFLYTGKLFGDFEIFRSGKEPDARFSQALWSGTLKTLAAFPIEIIHSEQGFLQTQWIVSDTCPQERFQIRVVLAPVCKNPVQAISVFVLRQIYCASQWKCVPSSKTLEVQIKQSILRKVRELYAQKP